MELAERMAARGHAVLLVVLRERQSEEWPTALDLVRLDMRKTPVGLFSSFARAHRFLRAFHPDLIHSHTFHANMAARLFKIMFPATAVLSTVHNVYEGPWSRMLAYRLTDPLSRHTTAVSEAAVVRYVRLKAIPAHKSSVVTNGIKIAEFMPSPERRASVRMQMGAQEEFVWLTAGRVVPAKDYPNLLRAFSLVRAEIPAARLWIAGETAAGDVGASVRWLGLRRDMPGLLDAADGFALASAWEGMPLALGEAMSMEKPVVATDVGGVRELVGEAGLLVPAKSPEALAQAMLELMRTTPEARGALGRAARERIGSYFSIDAKADEWETLYRKVLAKES